jgi:glycosyltransferase involved in cell wall biosynthesis
MGTMQVRYRDRDLVRRCGTSPVRISDNEGAQLVREGKAEALIDPVSPPIDKTVKSEASSPSRGSTLTRNAGFYPKVAWIHDTTKLGGAELSNQTVIKAGKELGFGIYECFPNDFDKKKLLESDLFVINNFFFFEPKQMHFILDLLFEYKKPFVKYEHDHREIIGDQARPKFARLLFGRSIMNVFISPFQVDNHRKHLGDLIEPYYILPPAVDTSLFKILPDVERDENKVVNFSGKLYHSKGFLHMLQFAANKKEYTFEIYTQNHQEIKGTFARLSNVKVCSLLPNDVLPKVYNSAGFTIHLPQAYEACGRTIAEGLLCGCQPIINKNVGIRSFENFHIGDVEKFNLEAFRKQLEQGIYSFWKEIDNRFLAEA